MKYGVSKQASRIGGKPFFVFDERKGFAEGSSPVCGRIDKKIHGCYNWPV